jgi:hypothetical protein
LLRDSCCEMVAHVSGWHPSEHGTGPRRRADCRAFRARPARFPSSVSGHRRNRSASQRWAQRTFRLEVFGDALQLRVQRFVSDAALASWATLTAMSLLIAAQVGSPHRNFLATCAAAEPPRTTVGVFGRSDDLQRAERLISKVDSGYSHTVTIEQMCSSYRGVTVGIRPTQKRGGQPNRCAKRSQLREGLGHRVRESCPAKT